MIFLSKLEAEFLDKSQEILCFSKPLTFLCSNIKEIREKRFLAFSAFRYLLSKFASKFSPYSLEPKQRDLKKFIKPLKNISSLKVTLNFCDSPFLITLKNPGLSNESIECEPALTKSFLKNEVAQVPFFTTFKLPEYKEKRKVIYNFRLSGPRFKRYFTCWDNLLTFPTALDLSTNILLRITDSQEKIDFACNALGTAFPERHKGCKIFFKGHHTVWISPRENLKSLVMSTWFMHIYVLDRMVFYTTVAAASQLENKPFLPPSERFGLTLIFNTNRLYLPDGILRAFPKSQIIAITKTKSAYTLLPDEMCEAIRASQIQK